jgi:Polyketide cyclase / dehydrase and lipid transport
MSVNPRSRMQSFHLDAPCAQVLPLFTARGEREWVPDWEPLLLSGAEERGSAFQTRNHQGQTSTWIVIDYRPSAGRASYARLVQDSNIGLVDVRCKDAAGGGTTVSVQYTLTPLNAAAQPSVDEFLEPERYSRMIEEWRQATSAALARLTAGGADPG